MRLSVRRCFIITVVVSASLLTWNVLLRQSADAFTHTCNTTTQFQDHLHALTEKVHDILRALDLTHFLCYGALWGQIRLSRLLPWEDKAVLCVLNEELSARDEIYLVRSFRKEGLDLSYDSTQGRYTVTELEDGGAGGAHRPQGGSVLLVVFELDNIVGMYRRVGWQRRLLPPHCETMSSLDCFPPRLIQPPLPMKEFGRVLVPVPREGIELQKYHYRDNWWKEVIRKNC